MLSPVWFRVPPLAYGGIESVVHLLVDGLVRAGVDVTLFASGDSLTSAELVSSFAVPPSAQIGQTLPELDHALTCLGQLDQFDLVHDHTGLLGLVVLGLTATPTVHTVHGPLDGIPGRLYRAACDIAEGVGLVSLTRNQRRLYPELPWVANIGNAIDTSLYDAAREPTETLAFLGRMSPDKGVLAAIHAARAAGRPLRIAAKCREESERAYFEQVIAPELGGDIEYVGELDHADKVELLRTSHALVFPIDWEEPFGLVMIEAMACGTPVVATRRGSVPEVLTHGQTGLIVDSLDQLPMAIELAGALDPDTIREEARERFSVDRMVEGYLRAYRSVLGEESRSPIALAV
jgi:glycosyltransferase involved in cell wall biosynthesis